MNINYSKRCMAGFVLSFVCASASAESQFGLGTQLSPQDGITIFLPIKADGGILLEPFFAYNSRSTSASFNGQDLGSDKFTVRTIGVGIFGSQAASETFAVYYGARVGLISVKATNTDYQASPTETFTTTGDGYVIQPTIGASYRATANVSFAVEVALNYSKVDTSETFNLQPGSSFDETVKFTNTRSAFVARYMF